jgi:hypothetical protein
MSPLPEANDASVREHATFGKLFEATPVPDHIEGFEVNDPEQIHEVWPEGTENAKEVSHFLPSLSIKSDVRYLNAFCIPKPEKSNSNSSHPLPMVQ